MQNKVIGQWRLVSWEITDSDGNVKTPLGKDGEGYLFYLPTGYVSVHLMNLQFLDFKKIPFTKQAKLSGTELEKFMGSYFSYMGKFTIDADCIHHHLEMSSIPSLINVTLTRAYQLQADQLTLTHKTEFDGANDDSKLVWNKVTY